MCRIRHFRRSGLSSILNAKGRTGEAFLIPAGIFIKCNMQTGIYLIRRPGELVKQKSKKKGFLNHRTGVYPILDSSSVASSLKITGLSPSLQLQIATPGVLIQSP